MFEKCEFCEKWEFKNVNFVNNETLKLWILWKMRFWKCEFLDKLRIFALVCPGNHEKWKLISGHSIVFVQSASSFRYGESHGPILGLELRGKSFSPQPLIFRVAKTCAGRGSRGTIMFKALVISVQRRRWGRGPRVQWLSGPEGPSFSLCSKTRFHTRQSPGSSIDCRLPQKGTKEWMEIFCKTYPSFFFERLIGRWHSRDHKQYKFPSAALASALLSKAAILTWFHASPRKPYKCTIYHH